jgi:hypothetical protein
MARTTEFAITLIPALLFVIGIVIFVGFDYIGDILKQNGRR